MNGLGRLERIPDLRGIWPDEARDFTPWLARPENMALLADFLGLGPDGLEVETVERFVGPYRADILARDTVNGHWVLVENQLERTNHTHLGQILTYAAGLDARLIVWIAREVAPEHAAAMEWLNALASDEGPAFFALEIELWRIGDSPVAPRFNAVVRPNEWTRRAASGKRSVEGGSDIKQQWLAYWTGVAVVLENGGTTLPPSAPRPSQYFIVRMGRSGMHLAASLNSLSRSVRVYLGMQGDLSEARFDRLLSRRDEIEAALDGVLDWERLEGKDRTRIAVYLRDVDPADASDWPRQHAWIADRLIRFNRVLRPIVAELP